MADAGTPDAGTPDAGVPDAGPRACETSPETNACFKCTDEQCCNQFDACAADPRCGDYYKRCLPQCKVDGGTFNECVVKCDSENGAGHSLFVPYFSCGQSRCLAECSNGPIDQCIACGYASCAIKVGRCSSDRDCDTLTACLAICQLKADPTACRAACRSGKSAQVQGWYDDKIACILQYCQTPCAI